MPDSHPSLEMPIPRHSRWMMLPLVMAIVAVAFFFYGISQIITSRSRFDETSKRFHNARAAESYACGYLAGQRAIISAANLGVTTSAETESCIKLRANAAENGFTGR